jgi:hypothetical protein
MSIEKLHNDVKKAAEALEKEMQKHYPVDSVIEVRLRHGQINPTAMTVYSHNGYSASVRAGMVSEKSRLGRYVRDIFYKDIL